MKLSFGAGTDTGRVRDHNEDNFLIDRNNNIFVVCDGMGGHAAGEVASAMTVNLVREEIVRSRDVLRAYQEGLGHGDRRDVLAMLERSVSRACYEVFDRARKSTQHRGMGTTVVVLVIVANRGFIAHVGDSRIYLLRQGHVHQLTEDHSLVNELVKQGRVSADNGVPVRYKNAVTRAVGVYESVQVDTLDFDVLTGDRFVLCTDGLHGYLDDVRLRELLEDASDQDSVNRLIRFANDRGGKDNITAIVVSAQANGTERGELRVRRQIETLKDFEMFRGLSYQEIVKILNVAREESFPGGRAILHEGDPEGGLYIVISGEVRVLKQGEVVAHVGPGAHFGEMSLIDRVPRSADVVAVTDVVTLSISRPVFLELLRSDAGLSAKLLWAFLRIMSARLRETTAELADLRGERTLEAFVEELPPDDAVLEGDLVANVLFSPFAVGGGEVDEGPVPSADSSERPSEGPKPSRSSELDVAEMPHGGLPKTLSDPAPPPLPPLAHEEE